MNDLVLTYTITLAFICVLGALFCVYRYYLGNRLVKKADELQNKADRLNATMGNIKRNYPELVEKRGELVASGLGDIGITGIMEELGIDPGLLKNPLVKGLIEKYAPRVLESMGKNGKKSQSEEIPLL